MFDSFHGDENSVYLLWAPVTDIDGRRFFYAYTDLGRAENARRELLECSYDEKGNAIPVGDNIKRLQDNANDIRIDRIPLLIGYENGTDLRGFR